MATINSISPDMMIEILLKLPVKSVLRLKSVSKLWASVIRSQQFIDVFMSLSLTRPPRLVLALNDTHEDRLFFFSSPHQSCSFLSFLELPRFKPYINYICNHVRGFLCCRVEDGDKFMVCNPTTGQVIPLDEKNSDYYHWHHMYLGYDPNNDQYKVLRLMSPKFDSHVEHSVCTLGGQRSSLSWRPIKASIPYYDFCYPKGVCIDGVVYYKCQKLLNGRMTMVVCFDVVSEQLRHIEIPENLSGEITNYLGKLAMYCSLDNGFDLWVLDDAKNQFWSKKTYDFPMCSGFSFEGITEFGEIVYGPQLVSDSLEIFCYNMEKKMGRSINITGLSDYINCSTLKSSFFYSSLLCSYVDNIIHL